MTTVTSRTCLIPDLDDQLVHALGQVEELLLTLSAWEDDADAGPGPFVLPAALAGRTALDALNRVQDAVTPTQTRTDHQGREIPPSPGHRIRIWAPGGRYEHRPLRLVVVDQHDLDVLAYAAADLGRALIDWSASAAHAEFVDAIQVGADAATGPSEPPVTPEQLVEQLARAHGLLDLADTADTDLVRRRLQHAGAGRDGQTGEADVADVVLTAAEDVAYECLASRANTMWTSSDPLARWTY